MSRFVAWLLLRRGRTFGSTASATRFCNQARRDAPFAVDGLEVSRWEWQPDADEMIRVADRFRLRDCHTRPYSWSMFKLWMETDNAAFVNDDDDDDDRGLTGEVARILHRAADRVAGGSLEGKLLDLNGNSVGAFALEDDGEDEIEGSVILDDPTEALAGSAQLGAAPLSPQEVMDSVLCLVEPLDFEARAAILEGLAGAARAREPQLAPLWASRFDSSGAVAAHVRDAHMITASTLESLDEWVEYHEMLHSDDPPMIAGTGQRTTFRPHRHAE